MSLYRRGKVYWSAIWVDGVRQMRSLETPNRRRAELLEHAFREELHTKRFQLPNLSPLGLPNGVNPLHKFNQSSPNDLTFLLL